MALTQTRPVSDSIETIAVAPKPALERALSTSDHKTLGRLWISAGALIGLVALALSAVAGFELADVGAIDIFEDEGQFIQAWSGGRLLVFFGCVVPILVGLATFLAPLQVGASAIAFGRGAAASFWIWLLSIGLLAVAMFDNGGPSGGSTDSVLLWIMAFGAVALAVCWALICIATTILGARTAGMRLEHIPISTWSFLVFALLGIVSLPVLIGELGLAYIDVDALYLTSKEDRRQLLALMGGLSYAPAIYWVAIPALGMSLDVLATQSGRASRLHKPVLGLIGSLAVFAFGADLFSFGGGRNEIDFDNALLVLATMGSALVILVLLVLGLDSLRNAKIRLNTPLLSSLLGLVLLMLGSVVALLAQIAPLIGFIEEVSGETISINSALLLNGSAFHDGIRGFVVGATLLVAIGAVHHWGHKIWGHALDDKAGILSSLLVAGGTIAWGTAYAVTGLLEQPALPEVVVGPKDGVELLNLVAAIGVAVAAAGVGLLALSVLKVASGRGSAAEPWTGTTLEWATSSPPPVGNFTAAPVMSDSTSVQNETEEV